MNNFRRDSLVILTGAIKSFLMFTISDNLSIGLLESKVDINDKS